MDVEAEKQLKPKRRRRKLFVQDRSFFGDGSLIYPEVNSRTVDGDILKLKKPSKSRSKNCGKYNYGNLKCTEKIVTPKCDVPLTSVDSSQIKFDKTEETSLFRGNIIPCTLELKMERVKRKRLDTLDSKAPASKKTKTERLDANADDFGRHDECSPIIDVVGVSSDLSEHIDLSNISGHHEEWQFSPLNNSVAESNTGSLSGNLTASQSVKKDEFVNRFLSDALSTLGMGKECLQSSGDESSFDDITEAADLNRSHSRKQSKKIRSTSYRNSRKVSERADLTRTKSCQEKSEFSDPSALSSGQKWLLKQMLPFENGLSTANPKERCSSPLNSTYSVSEESVQILEHIKPSTKKSKKSKKDKSIKERKVKKSKEKRKRKEKKRNRERGEEERHKKKRNKERGEEERHKKKRNKERREDERDEKKTNELQKNTDQQQKEKRKKRKNSETGLENDKICAPNDLEEDTGQKLRESRKHEECVNTINQIRTTKKVQSKNKKVNVEMQVTNEEILHPSSVINQEETVSSPKCQLDERLSSVTKKKSKDTNVAMFDVLTAEEISSHVTDNIQFSNSLDTHKISNEHKKKEKENLIMSGLKEVPTVDDINEHSDVSILGDSPLNQEISLNELRKDFTRVEKKIKKKKAKKEDCKVACSETLQQLVEKASSSLMNCQSSSTNEYSPDMFDGTAEDKNATNSSERREKENEKPDTALEERCDTQDNLYHEHEDHYPSLLEEYHPENVHTLNEQQIALNIGEGKTQMENQKKEDCEISESETLQKLVQKVCSSLSNCESKGTQEYSPDLFDANLVATSKVFNIKKKRDKNEKHESDPKESSHSHAVSSNELKKLSGEKKKSTKTTSGLDNVSKNSSPEVIDTCSPWHRLSQDSNGSFTARSGELSKISSQETTGHPYQSILTPHSSNGQGDMKKSHGSQRWHNESFPEEILTSAAALSLPLINPSFTLAQNSKFDGISELVLKNKTHKKPALKEGSCRSNKLSRKTGNSQNKSEPQENSQSFPTLSQNTPMNRRNKKHADETFESKGKNVAKQNKIKCTRCYLRFDSEVLMALHKCKCNVRKKRTVEEPHRTIDAEYKCDMCENVYVFEKSLKVHIKTVHEGLSRYKCDECPMRFSVKQTLTVHKRLHANILPYECRICSKQARTTCNLHHHYSQAHHLIPSFPCNFCARKNVCFYFEQDLKDHTEKCHSRSIISTIKTL